MRSWPFYQIVLEVPEIIFDRRAGFHRGTNIRLERFAKLPADPDVYLRTWESLQQRIGETRRKAAILDKVGSSRHDSERMVKHRGIGRTVGLPSPEVEAAMHKFRSLLDKTSFDDVSQIIALYDEYLDPIKPRQLVARQTEAVLARLAGKSFSLEENKRLVARIQHYLTHQGMRIACPRCGKPSLFQCRPGTRSPTGSFQFFHHIDKAAKVHVSSVTLPGGLKVVPAAPSRRRGRPKRSQ